MGAAQLSSGRPGPVGRTLAAGHGVPPGSVLLLPGPPTGLADGFGREGSALPWVRIHPGWCMVVPRLALVFLCGDVPRLGGAGPWPPRLADLSPARQVPTVDEPGRSATDSAVPRPADIR